jgi:putative PIG3 family NAD(P)H quinone oxidoreductase
MTAIPDRMRAAVITRPGDPGVLAIAMRPVPVAGPGDVLVRVVTSAVNRADCLQRAGRYPAPTGAPADIPGLEFAGTVAAVGPGVSRWQVGDRVTGLVAGGAHAEYLVTHERAVARIPDAVEWLAAGASAEACITAHDALRQAEVRPGDVVLVHAVASGVGLAAVQLARCLGARVVGTARGEGKLAAARAAGMHDGCVPGAPGWLATAVHGWTEGRGVDVVLDLVGGDYVAEALPAMAPKGRLVVVGTLAGTMSAVDLRLLLSRRLVVRGTVLRSRPLEERIVVTQAYEREVLPWLASGAVTTRVDATYPLERLGEAHALVEGNGTIGKVAITVGAP